jgi:magnesium transporter
LTVRDSQTIAEVLRDLQVRSDLPEHLDRLFVVDGRNLLRGALSLQSLVVVSPTMTVTEIMERELA